MTAPDEHLIDDICAGEPATVAAALQAATPHREALAPVLLARLLQAVAEPQRWTGAKGQPCPVFLPYLAAAWRLTEAHPLIIALTSRSPVGRRDNGIMPRPSPAATTPAPAAPARNTRSAAARETAGYRYGAMPWAVERLDP